MDMIKAMFDDGYERWECLVPFQVRDREQHTLDVWCIKANGEILLIQAQHIKIIGSEKVKNFLS